MLPLLWSTVSFLFFPLWFICLFVCLNSSLLKVLHMSPFYSIGLSLPLSTCPHPPIVRVHWSCSFAWILVLWLISYPTEILAFPLRSTVSLSLSMDSDFLLCTLIKIANGLSSDVDCCDMTNIDALSYTRVVIPNSFPYLSTSPNLHPLLITNESIFPHFNQ